MKNEAFTLKTKLRKQIPVIGTWNTLGSLHATAVLAETGLDFMVIDFEHGPFDLGQIYNHVAHCRPRHVAPMVRIPTPELWMIQQALDQGGEGIIVPQMGQREDVARCVENMKFYPQGKRGFTPFTKAGAFTNTNCYDFVKSSNHSTVAAIIIESLEGLENLDAILQVPHLDVVYFGAYDLSAQLGCPGDIYHSKVLAKIKAGIHKVNAKGLTAGGFVAYSKDDIKKYLDWGLRFITYGVDSFLLRKSYADIAEWFHS